jgi:GT2 family glycosyltransferase
MAAAEPALVSVVIVNWNGQPLLERCLAALDAQTYADREVIVVDNGSTDASLAWLAECQPAVRLLRNDHNRGFAAANNQGIRAARGRYVALLNNDAFATPGWLAALVAAAEAHPRAGMVASLMLFADRPSMVNSAGICVDRFGVSWDRAGGAPAADPESAIVPVFGASAGAALYRREMLAELDGFDEDFFAYLEDVDLAWRARWLGWQAVLAPAARVLHIASATSREGSAFKTHCLARNKLLLLLKNYPAPQLWRYAPALVLYDLLSLANSLLIQRTLAGLRGRLEAVPLFGRALRRRRQLQSTRRASPDEVFAALAAPAWPWQVQRRYQHLYRPAAERAA